MSNHNLKAPEFIRGFPIKPDKIPRGRPLRVEEPTDLVGHYFHSFDEQKDVEWQGHVLARVDDDVFLVQLFEWLGGDPSIRRLVSLEEMKGWHFYPSIEGMRETYERVHVPRARQRREEKPAPSAAVASCSRCRGSGVVEVQAGFFRFKHPCDACETYSKSEAERLKGLLS